MKNIIASIDFSEDLDGILSYAVNLCQIFDSELILFHAYQIPIAYSDMPVVTFSLEEIKNNAEEKINEIKSELLKKIEGQLKINIELKLGDPSNELEILSNQIKPLFIIMGTGKSTKLERAFIGSTTKYCINHFKNNILIVPRKAIYKKIQNIGFACDYIELEDHSPFKEISQITKNLQAALHVLHVTNESDQNMQNKSKQEGLLKDLLINVNPKFHLIKDDNVEHGLHHFAKDNHIDLIITIPKKHNLIDRIFNKQHSNDIVFHSEIPIMTIHA